MKVKLRIWRQKNAASPGRLVDYALDDVSPDMSFLEMLDVLNERLIAQGEEPVAFDHDCREGICGTCSLVIDGVAHGPQRATTTCQLHMRTYADGATITVEPFRARAFPLLKDLAVDRSAFDRIISAGGFISVNTGGAQDANSILVGKEEADTAMDAAACIGCGACVAACPQAAAMLFVSAKVGHLAHLPQGQPERQRRVLGMVGQMDKEGFGSCRNYYECEAVCPKEISVRFIAELNKEWRQAAVSHHEAKRAAAAG
jgi:succinate dehydrogenase / fumarate reductase, iron-sulfur subunit